MAKTKEQPSQWYDGVEIRSNVDGPITQMSFLRQSLLFAELSTIAYMPDSSARETVSKMGFHETSFFDRSGAQAYSFANENDCVIACRGTEPTEWNDIKADAYAVQAAAETVGRVHGGFKQEVDDLWPQIEEGLVSNKKTLWFTGHSLGGAMATICAGRCKLSHIPSNPTSLFTYGSPRVGNKQYINYVEIDHFRWVNNNDIVARVPPAWLGFAHAGREMYLNANGRLRRMTRWQRAKDRWRGFLRGLTKLSVDHFADHSMLAYIEYIDQAIQEESRIAHLLPPPADGV